MNFPDRRYVQYYVPQASRRVSGLRRRRQQRIATERADAGALHQGAAAAAFFGAFLGCLATLHLGACGFVPAIASALATVLLCGPVLAVPTTNVFPGEFFAAVYGGSFAGMTPILGLIDNAPGGSVMSAGALFVLLSIVCGLFFCLVAKIDTRSGRRLAGGCGGRSGAIAAVASFLFVASAPLFGADGALVRVAQADPSDIAPMSVLTCAVCMIGMFATSTVLRRRRVASAEPADRIFVAAAVALIGLMALHVSTPNDACILDAFYAGCFLGMSAPERLQGGIQPCFAAILLTALLVLIRALLPGVGGSLGLAALLTVAVLAVLRRIVTSLMNDMLRRNQPLKATTDASASRGAVTGAGPWWVSRRRAIAFAGSAAALVAIVCLVGTAQVASEQPEPALDMAASARVAEPSAPIPVTLALVEAKPATASADAVNADLGAVAGLSGEPIVTAIQTGQGDGGAANAPAEPGRADQAEGVAKPNVEAAQSAVPIVDMRESREALFREFLQSRNAHADAPPSQGVAQPVKRNRNRASQTARLVPAGSRPQPQRERRPDHPKL